MNPQCPACHQKTALVGNTVYCPNCGWNRDSAISSLQNSLKLTWIPILMLGGFAAFLYWGLGLKKTPLILFPCFPALPMPFIFLFLRSKLAKLKAMPASVQPSPIPSNFHPMASDAPSGMQAFPASPGDEALVRTPAPRQIRISKSRRVAMWVPALGLSLFVVPFAATVYRQWTLYHSFSNVRGLGWGIALETVVALAAFGIWRGQVRECDLLEHGEAVMCLVLRQWFDNRNFSWIEYEFTDFLGSLHKGSANDRTNQLFTGMRFVVFYDRDNPKHQVAYCSTLHEVIVPSYSAAAAPSTQELIGKR
jgi:hypothetical protein